MAPERGQKVPLKKRHDGIGIMSSVTEKAHHLESTESSQVSQSASYTLKRELLPIYVFLHHLLQNEFMQFSKLLHTQTWNSKII